MKQSLNAELGLNFGTLFLSDLRFYLAILAAPLALLVLTVLKPDWHQYIVINALLLFSFIIWQPVIEEVLFRGVIQGQLIKNNWAQLNYYGFSLANAITSLLFMSVHLVNHSVFWAISVILPSLVFGYFKDRHRHIYPGLILHSTYNACYLFAGILI